MLRHIKSWRDAPINPSASPIADNPIFGIKMTPDFRIVANGEDITALVSRRLVGITITDEAGFVSDSLSITLDNRDEAVELPSRGAVLIPHIGYKETGLVHMGEFMADEVEVSHPPAAMTITARAADTFTKENIAGIKAPKSRSWHGTTYAEIAGRIAGEHNLKTMTEYSLGSIFAEHIDQTNESDIAFLNRIIGEIRGYVKVANGYLLIGLCDSGCSPSGGELPRIKIRPADITSWRYRVFERGKFPAVEARYYDKFAAEEKIVLAGKGEPIYSLPHLYTDKSYATRCAKAKLIDLERGVDDLELDCVGDTKFAAEHIADVSGVSRYIDGEWVIKTCAHTLDAGGFKTKIKATKKGES